jgi:hypothetical protein
MNKALVLNLDGGRPGLGSPSIAAGCPHKGSPTATRIPSGWVPDAETIEPTAICTTFF